MAAGRGGAQPAESKLRLLIVDDDVVDRMSIVRGLRAAGIRAECVEAGTAKDALEQLQQATFDSLFMDFHLPDGTGLELLREVRTRGIRTPVVMLTGQGDEELAVRLMKAGASDYLPKTAASSERLAQSLRSVLRVHRAEQRARAAEDAREVALAARSRFFTAMSHELRTPINAILGYNDLLLASVYGQLTPEQAAGLEGAQRAARHLLDLVNDVLDFSKLEASRMELLVEHVDVGALIDDLLDTIRPLARENGCELHFTRGDCPTVSSDPRRVRQILLNLLSNAIRYGAAGPVEVRCGPAGEGGVEIAVADQGVGIAPEDLPRIFEEFVQLGNAKAGGTGLGLPISRRLSELLGGRLEAESMLGSGSTFRLVLPAVPPARNVEPASEADIAAACLA